MASEELQRCKREEYEMQLFGFHSREVFRGLQESANENIERCIQKLSETIRLKRDLDEEGQAVLEAETEQLIKAYKRGAEPHLKSAEIVISKIIAVPSNVLLDEDRVQEVQYTQEEFGNMQSKLADLRSRAKRATIFNACLKQELEDLDRFKICDNQVNRLCNVIENSRKCLNASSRMSEFIQKSKDLHDHLKSLGSWSNKEEYHPEIKDSQLQRSPIDDGNCPNINISQLKVSSGVEENCDPNINDSQLKGSSGDEENCDPNINDNSISAKATNNRPEFPVKWRKT